MTSTAPKNFVAAKPRIEKVYGKLTDNAAFRIFRAEEELKACESCNGQCRKERNRYSCPKIHVENGEVRIDLMVCKHELKCDVPYAGKTLDDYWYAAENTAALRLIGWYLSEKPKQSLYLFGETGTGKTLLASIITQEFARVGGSVIFGDVPSLLSRVKATFDTGGTQELINRYQDCDLLVLDDLGAGQTTDWSVGMLYEITNARYAMDKRLVVTSNFNLDDLEKRLVVKDKAGKVTDEITSNRIVSRLTQMCTQAFLGTKDRRRQK